MADAGLALPAGLIAPTYDAAGLGAILPAAFGALGVAVPAATGTFDLPAADRVVVVLVDGLGLANLEARAGHAPFLRARLPDASALTTTFPSTTAAALGAFGTGATPGRTGMVGYTQRNPLTGALANMVSWEGAGPPARVQREPPLFALAAEQVPVTSVGPARFAGSGMTVAALRGGAYRAAQTLGERVAAAVDALRAPGFAYLYWGELDKCGHHHGCASPQWGAELEGLDRELARLVRSAPRGTLVLITADHGMIDVDVRRRLDVAGHPVLSDGVALVGGEPRAMHVYTGEPGAVAARWAGVLGEAAVIWGREAAIDAGLFGDVRAEVRPVLGDVVVAMRGRATVVDSRTQTPASIALVGVHGSLTPEEMMVPLLVAQA